MATLMQKDALIDYIASTQALIFHLFRDPEHPDYELKNGIYKLPNDYRDLVQLKGALYGLDHSDIDFQTVVSDIKAIRSKFSLDS